MNITSIEWTKRPGTVGMTWNPVHARRIGDTKTGNFCTKISPGCTHCYAAKINQRWGNGLDYTVPNLEKVEFYLDPDELEAPLRRKNPSTIFVGDMFDLFHEAISYATLDRVMEVIQGSPQHTFQLLTKRAGRMYHYMSRTENAVWPPPNAWLGVSVESQKYADERIPLLLQTPAAVRFLSVEPQLENVRPVLERSRMGLEFPRERLIDWVICGGESGPGARPFNLAWAESLLTQCRMSGVPFFMKQVGSNPAMQETLWRERYNPLDDANGNRAKVIDGEVRGTTFWLSAKRREIQDGLVGIALKHPKGGWPAEWPEHLRVREFPA